MSNLFKVSSGSDCLIYINNAHTCYIWQSLEGGGGMNSPLNYHIHTWVMTSNINCIRHWDTGWWKLCFRCIIYKQYSYLVCLRFHLVQIASYMSTYTHTQMFYDLLTLCSRVINFILFIKKTLCLRVPKRIG